MTPRVPGSGGPVARALLGLHATLVYALLYLPIVVLVVYSFSDARYSMVWGGFTTRWYVALAQNADLHRALATTLVLAGTSTAIATVLGTAGAIGIARLRPGRKRALAETFFYLPVIVPDLVLALALLLFFVLLLGLPLGFGTLLLAHVTFNVAYVFAVVAARLRGFDWSVVEAARDLGATPWQAFRSVLLPFLAPGILGGALLALALSLDEFVISFFVTGPGTTTVPIQVWSLVRRGVTPEINALASVLVVVSLLLATASLLLGRSGSAKT
jgi:spermidine/putrescine transport system permease protein